MYTYLSIFRASAESRFGNTDRYGTYKGTSRIKRIHGNTEALTFTAEAIFHGYEAILENKFRRVGRTNTHLIFGLAHRKARCALLDYEGCQAANTAALTRIGEDDENFGQSTVSNEALRAV